MRINILSFFCAALRHTTQGPAVIATAQVRRIQSAGTEDQTVGVGATNGSTGPVVAVAGETAQRSSVDEAGAKKIEGIIDHSPEADVAVNKAYIGITNKIRTIGDMISTKESIKV